MLQKDLASHLILTVLKIGTTEQQVRDMVEKAAAHGLYGVCVFQNMVRTAHEAAAGRLRVITVTGYPSGIDVPVTKIEDAKLAIKNGAQEIDFGINLSALKSQDLNTIREEASGILAAAKEQACKVYAVFNTFNLNEEETAELVNLCISLGVDGLKTTCGDAVIPRGTEQRDVELLKSAGLPIKAEGLIDTVEKARELLDAGAAYVCSASALSIISSAKCRKEKAADMRKTTLIKDSPAGAANAYVADLYRANACLKKDDFLYLSKLRPFSVLLIKTIASRTLDIFPYRETPDVLLSEEGACYLHEMGITRIYVDNNVLEDPTGKIEVIRNQDLTGIVPGFYLSCDCKDGLTLYEDIALPLGMRRDGSLYTRIQWASTTEKTPYYWVNNLIDDDIERHGGTWGANTMGPANCILDFFGESKEISMVRLFHNVGSDESVMEEMAEHIRMYVSDDERCSRFGRDTQDVNVVTWKQIVDARMEMREYWSDYILEQPVKARYFRLELVKNFGTPPDVPWTETAELKIY